MIYFQQSPPLDEDQIASWLETQETTTATYKIAEFHVVPIRRPLDVRPQVYVIIRWEVWE